MDFEITRRQSTFWELRRASDVVRIHFIGKEEFAFTEPRAASYSILDDHALLVDYKFGWECIYIAGQVAAAELVVMQITAAINGKSNGWRPAVKYLNEFGAERILHDGHGQLLCGPLPIVDVCRDVLRTVGGQFTSMSGRPSRWPRQVLLVGSSYVIAKSFRVQPVT